ncbi:MAG TPA: TetR/AcrR family transcriptional regulator [Flavobacteriaceae bacterium]|nr:TetR/AcrR family transcriptional regulator [Flavobacteriaceae bacterium]MCB9213469.1 TetR/AcrR family transcriptional regulator [Alteromonas sp.]HPF12228.1 TetR/AcrR family transcriptional regulator [Flavobacteriaceae bacterium]HQU21985.1 TetR/AcrR family transcriptional regulator [Flavobacteriaceae bacterium]HQU65884.1 TetR/AcrR family transcriptional regulator [Flavobacteriaceae bacterium]
MNKPLTITTETQILEAAKSVFQRKGMEGARMQEIADEAGINKALLHYYFRNKQLLFEAVFNSAFSMLAPQLHAVLNDDTSVEEKIVHFCDNYISFMIRHPYLPNFIFQELNRNPQFFENLKQHIAFPTIKKFKSQVNEEIAQGILLPIDAEQLFVNIISLNAFPFIGKPFIKNITDMDESAFQEFLKLRKVAVSDFIIKAIKK